MVQEISLSKAGENDIPFIWELRQQTMKKYIEESYGWDEYLQYAYALERLDSTQIIELHTEKIGVLKIVEQNDCFHLHQIQLKPSWTGRGLGTRLIRDLIEHADRIKKNIQLQVLKNNPAANLYKRLGFRMVRETEFQYEMEYDVKSRQIN